MKFVKLLASSMLAILLLNSAAAFAGKPPCSVNPYQPGCTRPGR